MLSVLLLIPTIAVGVHGLAASDDDSDGNAVLADPCFNQSPVAPPFTAKFTVPPRAVPTSTSGGVDRYRYVARATTAQIIPGVNTPVWSFNGSVPGPTIIARERRPIVATFQNQLPPDDDLGNIIDPEGVLQPLQPGVPPDEAEDGEDAGEHEHPMSQLTIHFHGFNSSHIDDGYPANDIQKHEFFPGEQFSYRIENNRFQRPAFYWFHDHIDHRTGPHVYRGLAAPYVLRGARDEQLRLPGTTAADGASGGYGVYDVPLVVTNPMIDPATGKLIYHTCGGAGAFGDVIAVNGRQQPRMDVAARKYRFRILNASNARQYEFALRVIPKGGGPVQLRRPDEQMQLIATDHGLLRNPVPFTQLHMTPAQRREVVIDFAKYPVGTRLELVNLLHDRRDPEETPPGGTESGRGDVNDPLTRKLFPVMAFDVTRREKDPSQVPATLAQDLDPSTPVPEEIPEDLRKPVKERYFEFDRRQGEYRINGNGFDVNEVDADPKPNTVERWTLDNPHGGWGHPVHIHLGKFKVVSIEGRKPFPGEMEGWQDMVWLGPNQKIVVDHQFFNFTGRYVFHCHNNQHEDNDMMSQFDVGGTITRQPHGDVPEDGDPAGEDGPGDDGPDDDEPDADED